MRARWKILKMILKMMLKSASSTHDINHSFTHGRLAPTASGIATMSLGDALALVLSQRSKFTTRCSSPCTLSARVCACLLAFS